MGATGAEILILLGACSTGVMGSNLDLGESLGEEALDVTDNISLHEGDAGDPSLKIMVRFDVFLNKMVVGDFHAS